MRSLLPAFLLLAIGSSAFAKIRETTIWSDDRELILLNTPFGMGPAAHLEIELKDLAIEAGTPVEYTRIGFYLVHLAEEEDVEELQLQEGSMCGEAGEDSIPRIPLFTFQDDGVQDMIHKNNPLKTFSRIMQPGEVGDYSVVFANCAQAMISFHVTTTMFNMRAYDNSRDYLSVGEQAYPTMYLVLTLVFMAAAGVWIRTLAEQRAHVHKIHYVMSALLVFKVLTLLSQAAMYHYLRATGSADGWNVAYYIFTAFRSITFFSVVVLIGTGWSYMKPFLGDREKTLLMVVIPMQVAANLAIVILDETSPGQRSWITWRDLFHLLDIICCCAVLFPIVWSIQHLREAAGSDGKAARSIQKLTQFKQFYICVVVYIYFTRLVVYLLRTSLPYQHEWWSEAAGELATLTFYVVTAVKFRPHQANPYLALKDDDLTEKQLREACETP